jgi:hypothetical protein
MEWVDRKNNQIQKIFAGSFRTDICATPEKKNKKKSKSPYP